MAEIFESVTVTISKREYAELIGKAFAYDSYSKVISDNVKRGGFVTDLEKGLFYKEPKVDVAEVMRDIGIKIHKPEKDVATEAFDAMFEDEGMDAFFSDKEWQKIEELAEEEKKDE